MAGSTQTGSEKPDIKDPPCAVVNLSQVELTPAQVQVLSKGLSFSPTYKSDLFETKIDLFRFYRSLHLKTWYSLGQKHNVTSTQATNGSTPAFKPESTFTPLSTNPTLLTYIKKVAYEIQELFNSPTTATKHNLSPHERDALKELSDNKDIIRKPADKGGAVAVLDYNKYLNEAHRQLKNPNYYQELSFNPLSSMKCDLTALLNRAKDAGWINESEYGFLMCEHPRMPAFYMLPKIHKEPKDNPPRQTHRISQWLFD